MINTGTWVWCSEVPGEHPDCPVCSLSIYMRIITEPDGRKFYECAQCLYQEGKE